LVGTRLPPKRLLQALIGLDAGVDLDKPAPGSDQPLLKGKLWAGPGGEILIEVYVKVEGPKGTSYFK
jgi:hypothetical protein